MKKNLFKISIIIVLLTIPQIVFGAWWNPFSWKVFSRFHTSPISTQEPNTITREEFEKRYENIIKASSSPTTSPKIAKSSPKNTPSPIPNISPKTTNYSSDKDIADMTSVIDKVLVELTLDSTKIATLMNKMNSDYKRFSSYLSVTQANALGKIILYIAGKLDTLSTDSNNYQQTLLAKRSQIINSRYVDDQYWLNTGIPEMVAKEKSIKDALSYYENTYSGVASSIPQAVSGIQPLPTVPKDPAISQFEVQWNDYSNKLAAMKEMLLQEYKAAGGYWTDSQLESNAIQKLKEMGIKAPVSPYGGYINPNSGYSSTKCNSLNGGLDCYGSNGSRIQVIPMGNGQYELRSY